MISNQERWQQSDLGAEKKRSLLSMLSFCWQLIQRNITGEDSCPDRWREARQCWRDLRVTCRKRRDEFVVMDCSAWKRRVPREEYPETPQTSEQDEKKPSEMLQKGKSGEEKRG